MEKQTMGKFIAALRKVSGMTQSELADKLGVTNKSVSQWECDKCYPDLSLIPVIAELFSVTCDELLRGGRIIKESQDAQTESPKTEKIISRLIQKTLNSFKLISLFPVFLAILAFVCLLFTWSLEFMFIIGLYVFGILSVITEWIIANYTKTTLCFHDIENPKDNRLQIALQWISDHKFHVCSVNFALIVSHPVSLIFNFGALGGFYLASMQLLLAGLGLLIANIIYLNRRNKARYELNKTAQTVLLKLRKIYIIVASVLSGLAFAAYLGFSLYGAFLLSNLLFPGAESVTFWDLLFEALKRFFPYFWIPFLVMLIMLSALYFYKRILLSLQTSNKNNSPPLL